MSGIRETSITLPGSVLVNIMDHVQMKNGIPPVMTISGNGEFSVSSGDPDECVMVCVNNADIICDPPLEDDTISITLPPDVVKNLPAWKKNAETLVHLKLTTPMQSGQGQGSTTIMTINVTQPSIVLVDEGKEEKQVINPVGKGMSVQMECSVMSSTPMFSDVTHLTKNKLSFQFVPPNMDPIPPPCGENTVIVGFRFVKDHPILQVEESSDGQTNVQARINHPSTRYALPWKHLVQYDMEGKKIDEGTIPNQEPQISLNYPMARVLQSMSKTKTKDAFFILAHDPLRSSFEEQESDGIYGGGLDETEEDHHHRSYLIGQEIVKVQSPVRPDETMNLTYRFYARDTTTTGQDTHVQLPQLSALTAEEISFLFEERSSEVHHKLSGKVVPPRQTAPKKSFDEEVSSSDEDESDSDGGASSEGEEEAIPSPTQKQKKKKAPKRSHGESEDSDETDKVDEPPRRVTRKKNVTAT
mgnify:CR=1 FL=1